MRGISAHNPANGKATRLRRLSRLAVIVATSAAAVAAPVAAAKTPRLRVLARGLDNPHGLAFLPSGKLAVAEAGHAGSICLAPGECVGRNGQVTVISPGGQRTALAKGFPSLGGPFGTFGLGGLALQRGKLYALVGLDPQAFGDPAQDCSGGPDPTACVATVTAVQKGSGFLDRVNSLSADMGVSGIAGVGRFDFAYSSAHPDPGNPEYMPGDGNPFGLTAGPGGSFYVVDAASNTLDLVDRHGRISVLAAVPDPPHHKPIYDAAPTCAARTASGGLIIGAESGALWRWDGRHLRKILTGGRVGQVVGCIADRRGNVFIDNLSARIRGHFPNFHEKPSDGSIVKVTPDLKTSYVASGLNYPTGLTLGPDGHLYVAVNGLCPRDLSLLNAQNSEPGGCPAAGQIVRLGAAVS
jgi:hypothetical protein